VADEDLRRQTKGIDHAEKGYAEEQIIAALKQQESGAKTADICRQLGISWATFYLWKRRYAGLGVQELREMRQLREENARLKRLVADLSLDRQMNCAGILGGSNT
jgi:putative transposase